MRKAIIRTMQFLIPLFLIAGLTLAIPIILHLFYFRRFKKVYFTNVRFLKEVKEETSARSRLRNLLVLLMRLMAILFLVLAFAQPFIPTGEDVKKGQKAVSIYIDNSFSMSALSQDVPLIELAKERAREIVRAYNAEDQFQILSNDFSGRQQRLISREDALAAVDLIAVSPSVQPLSRVLERQRQALTTARTGNHVSYMISDFQRSTTDVENYRDTTLELNLVPLQAVQERNISIDSAWFEAPVQMVNQTNPLFVKVRNLSDEAAENVRLSLSYDGQTKPVGVLTIPPRASITDTVNITILRTGWHDAKLSITDYPIQFDDQFFFSFFVADKIQVLAVNDNTPNRYLQAAISGMPYFQLTDQNAQNLDYSRFPEFQLIVLNDLNNLSSGLAAELKRYSEQGGNILLFPGRNANLGTYRDFLNTFEANSPQDFDPTARQVSELNTEEFIFQDVFENKSANLRLPGTKGNFRFSRFNDRQEERLLSYRDGSPFLSKYRSGNGRLYLCAAPLSEEFNNLANNGEIFIPMLYKMAISSGNEQRIAYTIGIDEQLEAVHKPVSGDIVYKMKGQGEEFIPEQRVVGTTVYLGLNNQIRDAGQYQLFLNPPEVIQQYAFNFNRQESPLDYFSSEDLQSRIGPLANVISAADSAVMSAKIEEKSQGIVLWRWCIFLALLFLAAEVLLLRLWKV